MGGNSPLWPLQFRTVFRQVNLHSTKTKMESFMPGQQWSCPKRIVWRTKLNLTWRTLRDFTALLRQQQGTPATPKAKSVQPFLDLLASLGQLPAPRGREDHSARRRLKKPANLHVCRLKAVGPRATGDSLLLYRCVSGFAGRNSCNKFMFLLVWLRVQSLLFYTYGFSLQAKFHWPEASHWTQSDAGSGSTPTGFQNQPRRRNAPMWGESCSRGKELRRRALEPAGRYLTPSRGRGSREPAGLCRYLPLAACCSWELSGSLRVSSSGTRTVTRYTEAESNLKNVFEQTSSTVGQRRFRSGWERGQLAFCGLSFALSKTVCS